MIIKIDNELLHMEPDSCMIGDKLIIQQMKVEVACLYYLQLPSEKRAKGMNKFSLSEVVLLFARLIYKLSKFRVTDAGNPFG